MVSSLRPTGFHALLTAGVLASCSFPNYQWGHVEPTDAAGSQQGGGAAAAGTTASGSGGTGIGGTAGGNAAGGDPAGGDAGAPPLPTERGCTAAMKVCLRMDVSPEQEGWLLNQSGDASAELIDAFAGNRVMLFKTLGAEAEPGPVAEYSWSTSTLVLRGRLLFDLRRADIGPYTRVVIAQVDLGERALRFMLRSMPTKDLVVQLIDPQDSNAVLAEQIVPEPTFFEQTRLIDLNYTLAGPGAAATVAVESEPVAEIALGDSWVTAPAKLHFGAIAYEFPTSSAEVELDNVGFDDR